MSEWKRLAIRGAGFGAGAVLVLALIFGTATWYRSRPRQWDNRALSAAYDTLELNTQPKESSYVVEFMYDIQNNTDSTYRLRPSSLVLMARSSNGSLSKEWGHYQATDPTLTGPEFIPARAKVKVTLRIGYEYPNDFTDAEKSDIKKVLKPANRRLSELYGMVIFDEAERYRIDLDAPWQNWDDIKKLKEEN